MRASLRTAISANGMRAQQNPKPTGPIPIDRFVQRLFVRDPSPRPLRDRQQAALKE